MKNLIVTFTNLKGGTGKTTLCSLFATYCVEQGLLVVVLDADTQLSLQKNRYDDLGSGKKETPWKVFPFRVEDDAEKRLKSVRKIPGIVLVDCPGTVDKPGLKYIFGSADIAVMPFRYDRMNVRETDAFAGLFQKISKASIMFLPNLVTQYDDKRESLRLAAETAKNILPKRGTLLPDIADCVAVRDSNTIAMTYKQRFAVRNAFNEIVNEIKKRIEE